MRGLWLQTLTGTLAILIFVPQTALAHRSGCHNLHTCPSDSNSYVCGDLGYPCNGVSSIKDIKPEEINIPLLVEKAFSDTFDRKITTRESEYWKKRFRADKESVYQIRRTMSWHAANNSFGPPPKKIKATESGLAPRINALFRSVYAGLNPTPSENRYWLSRLADKPTKQALLGAIAWHKARNINH